MTMREISFRGKYAPSGMWIIGDLRQYPSGAKAIKANDMMHIMEVDPDTIGQYTGLTDKHGKKIFEGDIVLAVLPATRVLSEYVWPLHVVTFVDGAFGLEHNKNFVPLKSFAPSVTFEVIGNIHDNPELMEDKWHGKDIPHQPGRGWAGGWIALRRKGQRSVHRRASCPPQPGAEPPPYLRRRNGSDDFRCDCR